MTDLERRLSELEERMTHLERRFASTPPTSVEVEKPLSIREFLNSKGPQSDVEKTLFVGHYLEHFEKNSSFNVDDLRRGFSQAKEPAPVNINDAVNKNIHKGFLMEATERKAGTKAWVVTNSGELFVEKRLADG
jgi:hypothetical protein